MRFVAIKDPIEPDDWAKHINADTIVSVGPQFDAGEGKPISVIGSVVQCTGGYVFFTSLKPDEVLAAINGNGAEP